MSHHSARNDLVGLLGSIDSFSNQNATPSMHSTETLKSNRLMTANSRFPSSIASDKFSDDLSHPTVSPEKDVEDYTVIRFNSICSLRSKQVINETYICYLFPIKA